MKTKEEVIQDAWQSIGVNILMDVCMNTGFVTCYCENGMYDIFEYHNVTIDDLDVETDGHGIVSYRPKQLQGLENNNGWTTIESETDLPKETNTYHFISRHTGKMMKDYFTCDSKVSGHKNCFFKLYSHYQSIKDPKLPIHK